MNSSEKSGRTAKSWVILIIVTVLAISGLSFAAYEAYRYNHVKYLIQKQNDEYYAPPMKATGTPVR